MAVVYVRASPPPRGGRKLSVNRVNRRPAAYQPSQPSSPARLPPARFLLRRKDPRAEKLFGIWRKFARSIRLPSCEPLIRCEPRLGRLPVGGGSQVVGHQ